MKLRIRARLTLWYVVVLATILVALGVFLTIRLRSALIAGIDDSLAVRAQTISQQLDLSAEDGEGPAQPHRPTLPMVGDEEEVIAQLIGPDGHVLQQSGESAPPSTLIESSVIARAKSASVRLTTRLSSGADYRVVATPLDGGRYILIVARTLHSEHKAVRSFVLLFLVAAPITLAGAAAGGWALARAALRPVDVMTRTAASVDPSGPPNPLPVPDRDDELSRLALTLNLMLERLHKALDEERRFTADASHELRTPLGVMKAELDVALRSHSTPAEAKPPLESVREEVASMSRLVENLLILSRAEAAGGIALARSDVDVLELVSRITDRYSALAAERGVSLTVDGAPTIRSIDVGLVSQAIGNLIENAVKYTSTGSSISIHLDGDGSIAVTDAGHGISEDQQSQIFDRFYRADPARSRATGGAGLGLSIARRIVEAHGGTIDVQSELGHGSTFTVRLGNLSSGSR